MCDVKDCDKDYSVILESGSWVCGEHAKEPENKVYICKHCKIQVCGKTDLRPTLGRSHKRGCPRRKMLG